MITLIKMNIHIYLWKLIRRYDYLSLHQSKQKRLAAIWKDLQKLLNQRVAMLIVFVHFSNYSTRGIANIYIYISSDIEMVRWGIERHIRNATEPLVVSVSLMMNSQLNYWKGLPNIPVGRDRWLVIFLCGLKYTGTNNFSWTKRIINI